MAQSRRRRRRVSKGRVCARRKRVRSATGKLVWRCASFGKRKKKAKKRTGKKRRSTTRRSPRKPTRRRASPKKRPPKKAAPRNPKKKRRFVGELWHPNGKRYGVERDGTLVELRWPAGRE